MRPHGLRDINEDDIDQYEDDIDQYYSARKTRISLALGLAFSIYYFYLYNINHAVNIKATTYLEKNELKIKMSDSDWCEYEKTFLKNASNYTFYTFIIFMGYFAYEFNCSQKAIGWTMLVSSFLTLMTSYIIKMGFIYIVIARFTIGLCMAFAFACMPIMWIKGAPDTKRYHFIALSFIGIFVGKLTTIAAENLKFADWNLYFTYPGCFGLVFLIIWKVVTLPTKEERERIPDIEEILNKRRHAFPKKIAQDIFKLTTTKDYYLFLIYCALLYSYNSILRTQLIDAKDKDFDSGFIYLPDLMTIFCLYTSSLFTDLFAGDLARLFRGVSMIFPMLCMCVSILIAPLVHIPYVSQFFILSVCSLCWVSFVVTLTALLDFAKEFGSILLGLTICNAYILKFSVQNIMTEMFKMKYCNYAFYMAQIGIIFTIFYSWFKFNDIDPQIFEVPDDPPFDQSGTETYSESDAQTSPRSDAGLRRLRSASGQSDAQSSPRSDTVTSGGSDVERRQSSGSKKPKPKPPGNKRRRRKKYN